MGDEAGRRQELRELPCLIVKASTASLFSSVSHCVFVGPEGQRPSREQVGKLLF